jgi:hypothetical protein
MVKLAICRPKLLDKRMLETVAMNLGVFEEHLEADA